MRRPDWRRLTGALLLLAVLCGGCDAPPAGDAPRDAVRYEIGGDGQPVRVAGKPQRIVSVNLGTDEILVDLVAPRRIAALSYLAADAGISSVTRQAAATPVKIRDRNVEAIVALRPDLVLMADSVPIAVQKSLREMGIAVHVSPSPRSFEDVARRVAQIAALTGEEARGREITAVMWNRLEDIQAKVAAVAAGDRKMILAFSFSGAYGRPDGMFHHICERAGVVNGAAVAGLTKGRPLTKEQVVRLNPDIILLPTWSADGQEDGAAFREEIRRDTAYRTVKAIQNDRLVFVSDRYRNSISPYAVDSVIEIARAAYPQLFDNHTVP